MQVRIKSLAACCGNSVEDGELPRRARTDVDHLEHLLACDQDSGREGGGGAGEYRQTKRIHSLTSLTLESRIILCESHITRIFVKTCAKKYEKNQIVSAVDTGVQI